ncbi:BgTH12-01077 [Blumeria graminis f. sp. triticale]|uniref:BgtAcSP-30434 n=3 Tax=Blumeria graminis TaxID=34373 RepID=A0A9X9MMZ8_BLUGR|nr:hypothetical protein BGT96224_AcSP30434 [Blumeria graminis f. sp. tritici 96224]CAD6505587.1 BgTH12-01077 [Blumeria graminis f. sp. triticale]VDB93724.1 BgtAcSP-30434 [Blumeria graminis f. sp. tritici]
MHCLLAILLLAGDLARDNDRLAVMGIDRHSDYYKAFHPNGIRQFRGAESGTDIMVAARPTNGPGTYMAVYCSPSEDLNSLGKYISRNTRQLNERYKDIIHQGISKGPRGLQLSKDKHKNLSKSWGHHTSELLQKEDIAITRINSLNYQEWLDTRDTTLTPDRDYVRPNWLDNVFDISDVVLDGKFLLSSDIQGDQSALAWVEGRLNAFHKNEESNIWNQMKFSSDDDGYYRYLRSFLTHHFVEIKEIKFALEEVTFMNVSRASNDQQLKLQKVSEIELKIKQQLEILGTRNLRFVESPAYGLIGPFKSVN